MGKGCPPQKFCDLLESIGPLAEESFSLHTEILDLEERLEILNKQRCRINLEIDKSITTSGRERLDPIETKEFQDFLKAKALPAARSKLLRDATNVRPADPYPDFKLYVQFDTPRPLQIKTTLPGESPVIIDILASIRSDVRNIGHPLIMEAIYRYWSGAIGYKGFAAEISQAAEMKDLKRSKSRPEVFFGHLSEITRAICDGVTDDLRTPPHLDYFELGRIQTFDDNYFSEVCELVLMARKKKFLTLTPRVNFVKVRLQQRMPEIDHSLIIEWLRSRLAERRFPKLTPAALKNNFWSWRLKKQTNSTKNDLTEARKVVASLPPREEFESDLEKEFMDFMDGFLPFAEFPATTNLSKLTNLKVV